MNMLGRLCMMSSRKWRHLLFETDFSAVNAQYTTILPISSFSRRVYATTTNFPTSQIYFFDCDVTSLWLQRVHFKLDVGDEATDYNEVSEREKLSELQTEIRRLIDKAERVKKEQDFQRVSCRGQCGS